MGHLKPHHSCLRDDSQVWHPAGLESSVGGLKQNHPVSKMIHWFDIPQAGELIGMLETTSFYPLPTHYPNQTIPYYDDIKYTILHHILFKLYCWLNGSVVFGQRGTFVSIGMDSLRTTRLYTNIQTNLILIWAHTMCKTLLECIQMEKIRNPTKLPKYEDFYI